MDSGCASVFGMTAESSTDLFRIVRHARQPYRVSLDEQEAIVADMIAGRAPSTLIFTEHLPVYTIGTSGSAGDILRREFDGESIEVFESGRGGEVTYHGPGQLVCYVLADIRAEQDLHRHVWRLEEMMILALADFGIEAGRSERGIGVWVGDRKIAAVGVRCRKWVTFHGIAVNIAPNMRHFDGIVTCGMRDRPVTSMQQLGREVSREQMELAITRHAEACFASLAG